MSSFSRILGFRIGSPMLSGLFWSGIWLAIGSLCLSFLLTSTSVKEADLPALAFGVHGFASLSGGFVSARRAGHKGWYHGVVTGIMYTLLVLFVSFLSTDADWTIKVPLLFLLAGMAGAFGGMLGVNTGSGKK
jgi:putative membrane protein (TIGR04086 family)